MSGVTRQIYMEEGARIRVECQHVYISGFIGHHPLDVGVAYWYRGHYIYAFPNGNLIEPVSFSTRRGITISGLVQRQAPRYDARAAGSVLEVSVSALHRSKMNEWERQQEERKHEQKWNATEVGEPKKSFGILTGGDANVNTNMVENAGVPDLWPYYPSTRAMSSTALPSLLQSSSHVGPPMTLTDLGRRCVTASTTGYGIGVDIPPSMPSVPAYAPHNLLSGPAFTPHDRAQFLAASAPGSHNPSLANTPHVSRPVSPASGHASRGTLRPTPNVSRLRSLLMEEGIRRAFSPLENVTEGRDLSEETTAFRQPSHGAQLPLSNTVTTTTQQLPPSPFFSRNKPVGTGRPRRASLALNSAYNAVHPSFDIHSTVLSRITSISPPRSALPSGSKALADKRTEKCPIHGETCDGMTVTETWLTHEAAQGRGFADLYPIVMGAGGRRMVDWALVLRDVREEREVVGKDRKGR